MQSYLVLLLLISLAFVMGDEDTRPDNTSSAASNETNLQDHGEMVSQAIADHDHSHSEGEDEYEDEEIDDKSPYKVVKGRGWMLNVWHWIRVTPQHIVYIHEPQLPWYGNLIKWLRINVLFEPVY